MDTKTKFILISCKCKANETNLKGEGTFWQLLICWWEFVQYLSLPWLGSCVTAPDIFMNLDWKLPSLGELCPTSHDKRGKTWRVGGFFAPTEQWVEIFWQLFSLSPSWASHASIVCRIVDNSPGSALVFVWTIIYYVPEYLPFCQFAGQLQPIKGQLRFSNKSRLIPLRMNL